MKPSEPLAKKRRENVEFDTKSQLLLLREIKNSVNENNNLIKKCLGSCCKGDDINLDSIHVLAEKNMLELNRLSKMADQSVKLLRINDLDNLDSNNSETNPKIENYNSNYAKINIPNVTKIISLKTAEDPSIIHTSQAISMDEPQNSAAGVKESPVVVDSIAITSNDDRDLPLTQVVQEPTMLWCGVDAVLNSYKQYETGV